MSLADCKTLIQHAFDHGYGVAQVNTNGGMYDLTRTIVEVAEELKAPILLGAYEANLGYRGFEFAAMVMRSFAEKVDAPVAVHLDHGSSPDVCREAIGVGFNSVMIDGSHLPIDENIDQCNQVTAFAKPAGIMVEAEVGQLQTLLPDGSMSEVKNLCDPQEVERICQETQIDMLAVGIGNAHGFYKGQPDIRFDLLEQFARVSTVPLVLHGSTGLSDQTIRRCISMGMAKVNLGTLIRTRYLEYTAEVIAEGNHQNHPWRVSQEVCERIKPHVQHIIEVTGSAGRAEELASCLGR